MKLEDLRLPAPAEYVRAFRDIETRITGNQRKMLLAHHASPSRVTTATRMAEVAGFPNHEAANLQWSGSKAKPYQVRQVRIVITRHGLGGSE